MSCPHYTHTDVNLGSYQGHVCRDCRANLDRTQCNCWSGGERPAAVVEAAEVAAPVRRRRRKQA